MLQIARCARRYACGRKIGLTSRKIVTVHRSSKYARRCSTWKSHDRRTFERTRDNRREIKIGRTVAEIFNRSKHFAGPLELAVSCWSLELRLLPFLVAFCCQVSKGMGVARVIQEMAIKGAHWFRRNARATSMYAEEERKRTRTEQQPLRKMSNTEWLPFLCQPTLQVLQHRVQF